MQPIIFRMSEARNKSSNMRKGQGPSWQGMLPLPAVRFVLTGITKDETGAAVGGFIVYLFNMATGVPVLADTTVSDATGAYSFNVNPTDPYWVVDYKVGAPDKAGATLKTLAGLVA